MRPKIGNIFLLNYMIPLSDSHDKQPVAEPFTSPDVNVFWTTNAIRHLLALRSGDLATVHGVFAQQFTFFAQSEFFNRILEWRQAMSREDATKVLSTWDGVTFETRYEILQEACRLVKINTPANVPDLDVGATH